MCKDKYKNQQNKEFQGNLIKKHQNLWKLGQLCDKNCKKIRAWSHTPGSCQIFIQTLCSGKNRGSVTKLAIILHPQNIDGSIHPQPVPP